MSHPDPNGPAATQPWRVGDELWNPDTRERAVILETPLGNPGPRLRSIRSKRWRPGLDRLVPERRGRRARDM